MLTMISRPTSQTKALLRSLVALYLTAFSIQGFSLVVAPGHNVRTHCLAGWTTTPTIVKPRSIRHATAGAEDGERGESSSSAAPTFPTAPPPILNGKTVLPYKILLAGLKDSETKIAAVYAIFNAVYKKGTIWSDAVQYVGVTQDLASTLKHLSEKFGSDTVAYVRALSFAVPQPNAMQQVAQQWRQAAQEAGASLQTDWAVADALDYVFYDDEDDDDDDDDDDDEADWDQMSDMADAMESMMSTNRVSSFDSSAVVSPFETRVDANAGSIITEKGGSIALTVENVDKILDEVRPYLISDGGNVAVARVDADTKTVFLKLEGACGSCASSTVTMQMGIERVLKEQFGDGIKEVLRVDVDNAVNSNNSRELTMKAVQDEVNRLLPAITAMGGVCEIIDVDSALGIVRLKFRGANRVRQGLELAIRDVDFVTDVQFVMGDD